MEAQAAQAQQDYPVPQAAPVFSRAYQPREKQQKPVAEPAFSAHAAGFVAPLVPVRLTVPHPFVLWSAPPLPGFSFQYAHSP